MAQLPHVVLANHYAQAYLEKCKEIQRLANLRPAYQPQTEPPFENQSSIIVLDDGEDDDDDDDVQVVVEETSTQPSKGLQLLNNISTDVEQALSIEIDVAEPTDLHITGISVLREWIDISELDMKNQIKTQFSVNSNSQQEEGRNSYEMQIIEALNIDEKIYDKEATVEHDERQISENCNNVNDLDLEVVRIINGNWADVNVEEELDTEEQKQTKTVKEVEPLITQTEEQKEETEVQDFQPSKFKCSPYRTDWKNNQSKHAASRYQSFEEIQWFECPHCPYEAKTCEYLRVHLRQVHEQCIAWFSCTKCPLKFKTKQCLESHIIALHTSPELIEWLKCDQCDFKCRFKPGLKQHKFNKHSTPADINWFSCGSCTFKAKSRKSLKIHVMSKHTYNNEIDWFKCDKCDYQATKKLLLNRHMKVHAEISVNTRDEEDISDILLSCKTCGVKMWSKSKFKEHFQWHRTLGYCNEKFF